MNVLDAERPPRTPGRAARIRYARAALRRALAEAGASARAVADLARRLRGYAAAVLRVRRLDARAAAALEALGRAAWGAGTGDPALLSRLDGLDRESNARRAAGRGDGRPSADRSHALRRLAGPLAASAAAPPGAEEAHAAARAAVGEVAAARAAAAEGRASLRPAARADRVRVAAGLAVAALAAVAVAWAAGGRDGIPPPPGAGDRVATAGGAVEVDDPIDATADDAAKPGRPPEETKEVATDARKATEVATPAGPRTPARAGRAADAGTPPEDLRAVLVEAGFPGAQWWGRELLDYARFGSRQAADASARGDGFDKVEADRAAAGHRTALRGRTFRVGGLPLTPIVRSDVQDRGLLVELALPVRVRSWRGAPFYDAPACFDGALAGMHASEIDARRTAFLTAEGKLRDCSPAEADAVLRNSGVLYFAERGPTTLMVLVRGDFETLKRIGRNAKDYTAEVEFSGLAFVRPETWGYFRRDAYLDADWDCERLTDDSSSAPKSTQPAYFPTATRAGGGVPEIPTAGLISVRLLDGSGEPIGGYRARPQP